MTWGGSELPMALWRPRKGMKVRGAAASDHSCGGRIWDVGLGMTCSVGSAQDPPRAGVQSVLAWTTACAEMTVDRPGGLALPTCRGAAARRYSHRSASYLARGSGRGGPRTPEPPGLVHHVVASQELAGEGPGAHVVVKGDDAVDQGVADSLGLLDESALSAGRSASTTGSSYISPRLSKS